MPPKQMQGAYLDDRVLLWLVIVVVFVLSILEQVQNPTSKRQTTSILALSAVALAISTLFWGQYVIVKATASTGTMNPVTNAIARGALAAKLNSNVLPNLPPLTKTLP